ncbi:MAG: hypothetical protein J0I36_14555 [Pandoraea sp.]|uniref:hypothetical protein n=1 Tax=Pandoraea sp. 64-18 TaxID=1895806 RepID=UPI000962CEA1|nr:hypothetical protein [Pandoraea sp. 64-18]MBN9116448.1 hypothetical protein [Pandoraea sp.]OJY20742.1 MAG: hypothetical protein BGP02_09820 [Pandoraea sp. 64-18]
MNNTSLQNPSEWELRGRAFLRSITLDRLREYRECERQGAVKLVYARLALGDLIADRLQMLGGLMGEW